MKHQTFEIKSAEGGEDDADPVEAVTKALGDLTATVGDRLDKLEGKGSDSSKLVARLDKLEAKMNRPQGGAKAEGGEPAPERKAFGTYLRLGNAAPADELKALTVSSDAQGGYLAPAELSTEFLRDLVEFSPIRSLASVRSTGAPSVIYPTRTGITNAAWRGETQAQTGSEPAFGQSEIVVRELSTYVDVSNQLLADSGGQADSEVRLALAEDFGAKEGLAFLKGDGFLAPEGLLTAAGVAETSTTVANWAATTGIVPTKLIEAFYALQAAYRNRGTWLMNGGSLAALRNLRDADGHSFWQPALAAGQPETILGRPVVEVPDMDNPTAGSTPIIFGDIATAYRIVDRVGLSVLVNPYLRATEGITRIHATRRVGGKVVQPAAVRKITVTA